MSCKGVLKDKDDKGGRESGEIECGGGRMLWCWSAKTLICKDAGVNGERGGKGSIKFIYKAGMKRESLVLLSWIECTWVDKRMT